MMNDVDQHHISYEIMMLKNAYSVLQQGLSWYHFNVYHESWIIHAYNLMVFLETDFEDFKRRAEEQVLTLTSKRTLPDNEDRILSPYHSCHRFLLDKIEESGIEG